MGRTHDREYRNRPDVKARYAAYYLSYYRERRKNPIFNIKYRKRCSDAQRKLRLQVLEKLGGKCIKCGFSDMRALHIDHVNGGGSKVRRTMTWNKFYRAILNNTLTFKVQILCANHNSIKRYEEKELQRPS